jgi:hypothetical protein
VVAWAPPRDIESRLNFIVYEYNWGKYKMPRERDQNRSVLYCDSLMSNGNELMEELRIIYCGTEKASSICMQYASVVTHGWTMKHLNFRISTLR